jgi:beta-lactamase regulating signal transducer with metallopeptidase domain
MNTLMLCKVIIVINVLLMLSTCIIGTLILIDKRSPLQITKVQLLKLTYFLIFVSCILPIIAIPTFSSAFFKPSTQIWSAEASKYVLETSQAMKPSKLAISVGSSIMTIKTERAVTALLLLFMIGIVFIFIQVIRDVLAIRKITNSSLKLRSVGNVTVLVCARDIVPFSFWLPFRAFVVVPQSLISELSYLRMVIVHEFQHHRHFDTKFVYAIQAMKALFFWNPFIHLAEKITSALQEFACDESVVGRHGTSSRQYCACLLWVAQRTMLTDQGFVGTTNFVGRSAKNLLKWRIEFMLNKRDRIFSRVPVVMISACTVLALALVAHGASSGIQDRRVSFERASAMAAAASQDSNFPMVVNDLVLTQLNRYLGTPDGREFMRRSIQRMKTHETFIVEKIAQYGLPSELLAIPIVESGYQNLKQGPNPAHGAGIWMFIEATARTFNLRVDEQIDDRLDVQKETDAAMRLLAAEHHEFKDWGLAVMSYNAGRQMVHNAIEATGSRDPWTLIEAGFENDKGYLASVIAAALIIKNPSSLD